MTPEYQRLLERRRAREKRCRLVAEVDAMLREIEGSAQPSKFDWTSAAIIGAWIFVVGTAVTVTV